MTLRAVAKLPAPAELNQSALQAAGCRLLQLSRRFERPAHRALTRTGPRSDSGSDSRWGRGVGRAKRRAGSPGADSSSRCGRGGSSLAAAGRPSRSRSSAVVASARPSPAERDRRKRRQQPAGTSRARGSSGSPLFSSESQRAGERAARPDERLELGGTAQQRASHSHADTDSDGDGEGWHLGS